MARIDTIPSDAMRTDTDERLICTMIDKINELALHTSMIEDMVNKLWNSSHLSDGEEQ